MHVNTSPASSPRVDDVIDYPTIVPPSGIAPPQEFEADLDAAMAGLP